MATTLITLSEIVIVPVGLNPQPDASLKAVATSNGWSASDDFTPGWIEILDLVPLPNMMFFSNSSLLFST